MRACDVDAIAGHPRTAGRRIHDWVIGRDGRALDLQLEERLEVMRGAAALGLTLRDHKNGSHLAASPSWR